MNTTKTFKVVNKSKDGCTIVIPGNGAHKYSWEAVKQKFVIEGHVATLTEEYAAQLEKANDLFTSLIPIALMLTAQPGINSIEDMARAAYFGEKVEELAKLLECTPGEAIILIKERVKEIRNFDFNRIDYKKQYHANKKKAEENMRNVSITHNGTPSATQALGDNPALSSLYNKLHND